MTARNYAELIKGGPDGHSDALLGAFAEAAALEAAALEADALVLVSGGVLAGSRDLGLARRMITDAIAELVPRARELGVRLGIESLHPMFCADRCVLVRLGDAVNLALLLPADVVGVAVNTYTGYTEVEIFNQDIWDAPADETASTVKARFATLLG